MSILLFASFRILCYNIHIKFIAQEEFPMCTAATYQTNDFYFGRTLDYESSYGEEIVIVPRQFRLSFLHMGVSA